MLQVPRVGAELLRPGVLRGGLEVGAHLVPAVSEPAVLEQFAGRRVLTCVEPITGLAQNLVVDLLERPRQSPLLPDVPGQHVVDLAQAVPPFLVRLELAGGGGRSDRKQSGNHQRHHRHRSHCTDDRTILHLDTSGSDSDFVTWRPGMASSSLR